MTEIEAEIEYKIGADVFKVVLASRTRDIFVKAAQQQDIVVKEGEELIAALLAYAKGAICSVHRYKNGQRHDSAGGEPAIKTFGDDGVPVYLRFYRDGKLNDGVNGEPAIQDFLGGKLFHAYRYNDGKQIKNLSQEEMAACHEEVSNNKAAANQKAFLNKIKVQAP